MKINTFVCSCHLAEASFECISAFLKKIFAENLTPEVNDWIEQEKDCYIYERGFFNSDDSVERGLGDERLELLRQFYVLDMTAKNHDERSMESPWGAPKSLRVQGFSESRSLDFSRLFTPVLVELDITGYHGNFSAGFWCDLVESSPSLESLAVPICSFLFPREPSDETREQGEASDSSGDTPNPREDIVQQSLQKLYLMKLYIKGEVKPHRLCDPCPACSTPLPLRASDIPEMKNLDRLEELTFNNVEADPSALKRMANPFAHTVRLHLNWTDSFCGMRAFIQGCRNLTNFKLSGFNEPLNLMEIWPALAACRKFKQLCLGTRSQDPLDPVELCGLLSRIPRSVRVIHFHVSDSEHLSYAQLCLNDCLRERKGPRFCFQFKIFPEESLPLDEGFRALNLSEPILGRSLCHSESFTGFVTPKQWEVRGD